MAGRGLTWHGRAVSYVPPASPRLAESDAGAAPLEPRSCIPGEKLESMPAGELPTTLTSLLITECLLHGPRCQEGGVERPKISHISGIHIFPIPDQVNEH